jgi:stage III sporulation protein SpoIIIAA
MTIRQPKPHTSPAGVTNDLDALLDALPPRVAAPIRAMPDKDNLLEVVLDLGRPPEARFLDHEAVLDPVEVADDDLRYVASRIGDFGDDNRAGIPRTLHRISAMRNRKDRIVGLTCRVGRAVYGTIDIISDIVASGKSILLLGKPGVGKTTMLREVARVLAETKRVVVVDTSNEIAGDGDIPHPGIGRARRMQVRTPALQHAVMIEAVENHMPEVIIIDEIGTELEAAAARTIAERGVQLVGTAHGNTLENLMMNPTLSDLVGGIQSVTLGDEEARRRGTQKSILERKAPPTFDIVVEIQDWQRVAVHADVAETVDSILRNQPLAAELRYRDEAGEVHRESDKSHYYHPARRESPPGPAPTPFGGKPAPPAQYKPVRVYAYGVSHNRLAQAAEEMHVPVLIARDVADADLMMTLKSYYRRKPQPLRDAERAGLPIYVLRANTILQMESSLAEIFEIEVEVDPLALAIRETEEAIQEVRNGTPAIELSPQAAYIRRLQHQMAEKAQLNSRSWGKEPFRKVKIFKGEE